MSRMFGKVVKLFLFDGTPNGRWRCELSNWTGVAYKIPRTMVKESETREELASPGVYFLFGYDEDKDRPLVYIGEAESIIKRLKQHLDKKDFWNEVIVFISKGADLNKAHIKYLEYSFYTLAKETGRYSIDNSNTPTCSSISEAEEAEMEEFIYNAKILVNALGHKVFEGYEENQAVEPDQDVIFYLSAGSGKACGKRTSNGFLLLKGSSIYHNAAASLRPGLRRRVEEAKENGEIVDDVLQVDKLFSSSSTAGSFVAGYNVSGPLMWKDDQGRPLKSFEDQ